MKNPLYNKQHGREYLVFGALAAIAYIIFVFIFLSDNRYENLYWLFFGNMAFTIVIAIHSLLQINRPYEGRSSIRMTLISHSSAFIGVVISCVLVAIAVFIYFPNMASPMPTDKLVTNAHDTNQLRTPAQLMMMIFIDAIVPNFALGSFFSVLISYVCKRDQTKEKTAELDKDIHLVH